MITLIEELAYKISRSSKTVREFVYIFLLLYRASKMPNQNAMAANKKQKKSLVQSNVIVNANHSSHSQKVIVCSNVKINKERKK